MIQMLVMKSLLTGNMAMVASDDPYGGAAAADGPVGMDGAASSAEVPGASAGRAARMTSLVDTRALGKPRTFDGIESIWQDWSFMFRAYCSLLSPLFAHLLLMSGETKDPIPMSPDEGERALQVQLYYLLAMLLTSRALVELKQVDVGNGLEAWRRLVRRYEPRTRNRQLILLQHVMQPDLDGSGAEVVDKLNQWEHSVRLYERAATTEMVDDLKIAVMLKSVGEDLKNQHPKKQHFQAQLLIV